MLRFGIGTHNRVNLENLPRLSTPVLAAAQDRPSEVIATEAGGTPTAMKTRPMLMTPMTPAATKTIPKVKKRRKQWHLRNSPPKARKKARATGL